MEDNIEEQEIYTIENKKYNYGRMCVIILDIKKKM